jgi:hypothetical protein
MHSRKNRKRKKEGTYEPYQQPEIMSPFIPLDIIKHILGFLVNVSLNSKKK